MQPLPDQHVNVLVTTILLPLFATFVMEGVESLVESNTWKARIAKTGWDLCVLGVGTIAGIFGLPEMQSRWGQQTAVYCALAMLVAFGAGVLNVKIRKTPALEISGKQALTALGCGGAALVLPWYFALHF